MNEVALSDAEQYYTKDLAKFPEISDSLRESEMKIDKIREQSAQDLGRELSNAKHMLEDNGIEQSFKDWVKLIGLSSSTAYNLVNYFEASNELSDAENEIFSKLPKGLAYTMSNDIRKSEEERDQATNAALDAVFSGDVTSLPEYKQLIKEKKDLEAQKEATAEENERLKAELDANELNLITLQDDYEELRSALDESRENVKSAPEIKYIEKMPDDYEQLKQEHNRTMNELQNLKALRTEQDQAFLKLKEETKELQIRLEEAQDDDENSEALRVELEQKNKRLNEQQQKINELQSVSDKIISANEVIDTQFVSLLGSLETASDSSRDNMKPALLDLQQRMLRFVEAIDKNFNQVTDK